MSTAKGSLATTSSIQYYKTPPMKKFLNGVYRSRYLYILLLFPAVYKILFSYFPMYGVLMAFQNFDPGKGIMGSDWVGLQHFTDFLSSPYAFRVISNTFILSLYGICVGYPIPIILALFINEVKSSKLRRTIQTIVYLPHFISLVVICGLVKTFLSPSTGIVNNVIDALGGQRIDFMTESGWFRHIYIWSGQWQNAGWASIMYLAALAGVDQDLYEAAIMDGATRVQKMWHISLPSITPTIIILLILSLGGLLDEGFEKVILLYNELTYKTADLISSYVYRRGIQGGNYSSASAIGMFNAVVGLVFLMCSNAIAKKVSETSLW